MKKRNCFYWPLKKKLFQEFQALLWTGMLKHVTGKSEVSEWVRAREVDLIKLAFLTPHSQHHSSQMFDYINTAMHRFYTWDVKPQPTSAAQVRHYGKYGEQGKCWSRQWLVMFMYQGKLSWHWEQMSTPYPNVTQHLIEGITWEKLQQTHKSLVTEVLHSISCGF